MLALATVALAATVSQTGAQLTYTPYAFTNFVGMPGTSGTNDGTGGAARFGGSLYVSSPSGVAVDTAGNVYVADEYNHRVAKGTPLLQFDTGIGVTISNNLFQMRLIGPSGSNVVVEASANLQGWTPFQTNALPPAGLYVPVPLDTNQN